MQILIKVAFLQKILDFLTNGGYHVTYDQFNLPGPLISLLPQKDSSEVQRVPIDHLYPGYLLFWES